MNITELTKEVAEASGVNKDDSSKAIEAVLGALTKALASGDAVRLTGFGIFEIAARGERPGRNPRTGEPMTFAASKAVKFKAGKALKDSLNA